MTIAAPSPALAAAPQSRLRLQVIRTEREFLELEPVWDRLRNAAGLEHPFLEFDWVRSWWECFGAGSELNVVVVWAGDEALAIAPLLLTRCRMMGVPVRRLGFFYNSHVPRADFLVAAPEAYRTIWQHLAERRDWDVLQLCQLPNTSPTLAAISNAADRDGYPTGLWTSSESPYIELDSSWQEYLGGLATKHRANLRNRFKRLGAAGSFRRETIATEDGLEHALADGLELEAAAWKGDEGTAISCSPELCSFYAVFARRSARHGWLRLNFLRASEQRIAFDYSLEYRNHAFLLKQGYDPAASPYSPSNLLLAMELESLCGRSGARFDFLGDFAEWKRSWAKESLGHSWLYVFSKGPKGRLLHLLKFGAVPLAKRLMRRS
jgi:CelD/BcsL family acetyltransferase involved in cellulose biosynthesis